MDITNDFETQLQLLKASFQEKLQEVIKTEFNRLLNENPHIVKFAWTQYTPYFLPNAERCEFFVGKVSAIPFDRIKEGKYIEDLIFEYSNNKITEKLDADFQAFPELMLIVFGDHVVVRVTRDVLYCEDYDHE